MFYYGKTSFFLYLHWEKVFFLYIYLKPSGSHKNYKLKLQNSESTSYKYTKIALSHLFISK